MITKTIKPNVVTDVCHDSTTHDWEKKLKENKIGKGPVVTYAPQYKTT
jgi:hypothetical protein